MKICIPTDDDRKLGSTLSAHFGDAPFFTMVDVDSGDLKVVRNPDCHDHHGSCHHVPLLSAHAVDAVVCSGIGGRARAGLREAGIDVLVPPDRTVAEIVRSAGAGELSELPAEAVCGGGRRHGHGRSR